ncbi:OmpH family outer membrane protein [Candidatus Magnetomonas plexicatena]|uniref:OmpH family outer membrane protein n=1 Tax=Candidatus Magnetomonas plexicatena TaxID=2552947 RepID=UPI001C75B121|nr:OmpH family outer membrane protein [Nitrospirales bacterium LBB_01]
MKKVLSLMAAVTVVIVFAAGSAFAADHTKIGFVDIQKVFMESEQGKKAKETLDTFVKSHQVKIDEKEKAIEKAKEEYDKKSSVMSDDAKKKKQEELASMLREYKRFAAESQDEVRKKEQEITKDIFKAVKELVVSIGKDEGYAAILDNSMVVYSDGKADITDKIVKKLNEKNK